MDGKEFDVIAFDAHSFSNNLNNRAELATNEGNALEFARNTNIVSNTINNNMLISNQVSTSTNINFERCNEITIGNIFNVGIPQMPRNSIVENLHELDESIVYKKTPTIKTMMESNQYLNDKYLDIFCIKLGHKFQSLGVHLKIDELDIKQAMEDHKQFGTSEVLFQILSKYFQIHNQHATVGWITRFLWKNNYKQNVWAIKELWKILKELDGETIIKESNA